jgi:hypothetical protein
LQLVHVEAGAGRLRRRVGLLLGEDALEPIALMVSPGATVA